MATLNRIPHSLVAASKDSDRLFNTIAHTHAETSAIVPHLIHNGPAPQPWLLLSPFLPLFLSSQRIAPTSLHTILLPRSFLLFLRSANPADLITARIPESDVEDLAAIFPTTTVGGANIAQVLATGKYFARLDTCSLKDPVIRENAIKDVRDLWTRLATSARGNTAIINLLAEDPSKQILLYLFPWNPQIQTSLKYRVFCAPPHGKLTAISRYKWHAPWHHATKTPEPQQVIADNLVRKCRELHERIMGHEGLTEELKGEGFVFDVCEDAQTQEVVLLELNDSGAMKHCGSCLFQWVRGVRVLYGMEGEREGKVEVKVAG